MPLLETAKRAFEVLTGHARPTASEVLDFVRERKPHAFWFKDDGRTPNNAVLPLIYYRSSVALPESIDPAAIFEVLFKRHGWANSWRDAVYDFLHFHTHTHEVLGIARGSVRAQFGGAKGKTLTLKAGDVVILPAGTGHRKIKASSDLLIVGAYPANGGEYDEPKPDEVGHIEAKASIARVHIPRADPVYGKDGPLKRLWRLVH